MDGKKDKRKSGDWKYSIEPLWVTNLNAEWQLVKQSQKGRTNLLYFLKIWLLGLIFFKSKYTDFQLSLLGFKTKKWKLIDIIIKNKQKSRFLETR